MKPGSWLEVSDYDAEKAKQIYSHGNIDCFIVRESEKSLPPQFPFLIVINSLNEIENSQWKSNLNFNGFLLRTSDPLVEGAPILKENLWVEYFVSDFTKAQIAIRTLSSWNIKGYFLTCDEKINCRKINQFIEKEKIQVLPKPYDLFDSNFSKWESLELYGKPKIELNPIATSELSIIIPHYESPYFICATLKHLQKSFEDSSKKFEVLVVDDGSHKNAVDYISYFASRHLNSLPIRLFTWNEKPILKSGNKIFRAGASRNWGAALAKSENLFFLDSDMLTPLDIADQVLASLKNHDVVQFVRKHIPKCLSNEASLYDKLINSPNLYIEESTYWRNLFESPEWSRLPHYWKYTCTYALAIKKEIFCSIGRFRRNFIQYGLEDTDFGFRLSQQGYKFYLNKTPLLHLTPNPDTSQGVLSKFRRMNRLAPTARIFYRLHLNPIIYENFQYLLD